MHTEWVVDRKKVPKNWKPTYDRIKAKIDAARSELPKDNNEIEEFVKDRPGKTTSEIFLYFLSRLSTAGY